MPDEPVTPVCPMLARHELHQIELDLYRVLRSEEHTSELQSQSNLVCRLLLEKKKNDVECILMSEDDTYPIVCLLLFYKINRFLLYSIVTNRCYINICG